MIPYPHIDPVALSIGPLKVHWYGLMYLISFLGVWFFGRLRTKKPGSPVTSEQMDDLLFYGALGVVLGGRLGYVFFYNFPVFLDNPLILLKVWEGGMSFHGGMLGVFIGMWLFGKKNGLKFFTVTDFIAPLVPIGLFAGRIGNFINGELWGKPTYMAWGVIFPGGGSFPRHPSQLYEAILEGIVLFLLLWVFSSKQRPRMAVSGLFLLGYGAARFFVEFYRLPDAHLGYLAFDWLTMGQLLTAPMILFGLFFLTLAYRKKSA